MLAGAGLASCLRSQLPPGLRRENCLFLSRGKKLLENIKSKEVADQHHFLLYHFFGQASYKTWLYHCITGKAVNETRDR
jgi:hypothetical protein